MSDTSRVNRRKFIGIAASVAAASSLAAGQDSGLPVASSSSKARADYPVTINATASRLTYTYVDSHNKVHNAYRLKVASAGQSVTWQAATSHNHHYIAIFFPTDTPFVDDKDRPIYAFVGSEIEGANGTIGAKTDPDASGSYEYYVTVFDKDTGQVSTDDPKIIVGSGGLEANLSAASEDLTAARKEAQKEDRTGLADKIKELKERLDLLIEKR